MGGIFRTIGNTFNLIKMSWRVLQLDRELIVFPILSGLGVLVIAGSRPASSAGSARSTGSARKARSSISSM